MRFIALSVFLMNTFLNIAYSQEICIKGGYTYSETDIIDNAGESYRGQTEYEWYGRNGFNAGVEVLFPVNGLIGLKTGLIFTTKGFKMEYSDDAMLFDIYKASFSDSHTFNMSFLEIPILFSCQFPKNGKFQFLLTGGPFLGIAAGGSYISEIIIDCERDEFDFFQKTDTNIFSEEQDEIMFGRFETGIDFGIGFLFKSFYLGADFDYTFIDLAEPISDPIIRHKTLRLSVGYFFKVGN